MALIALPAFRPSLSLHLLAGSLLLGMFFGAAGDVQAQTPGQGGSTTLQAGAAPANGPGANAAGAARPRKEPSEAYRESIRRTIELRRQRRSKQGQGIAGSGPVGAIVPWPMPPALIIRHTPRVHDEIGSFLGLLRR
jgi:hypothetical protein